MQQHGTTSTMATVPQRPLPQRLLPQRSLAPAFLLLMAGLALPARPGLAAPASEAEMEVYASLAALNLCIARAAGVEFELSAGIAAETISTWIEGSHDSAIAMIKDPLSLEQLRQGSLNSAVIGATELCPALVPEEVRRQVEQAVKNSTSPAPSPAKP
jgi:hypothetical protein